MQVTHLLQGRIRTLGCRYSEMQVEPFYDSFPALGIHLPDTHNSWAPPVDVQPGTYPTWILSSQLHWDGTPLCNDSSLCGLEISFLKLGLPPIWGDLRPLSMLMDSVLPRGPFSSSSGISPEQNVSPGETLSSPVTLHSFLCKSPLWDLQHR